MVIDYRSDQSEKAVFMVYPTQPYIIYVKFQGENFLCFLANNKVTKQDEAGWKRNET